MVTDRDTQPDNVISLGAARAQQTVPAGALYRPPDVRGLVFLAGVETDQGVDHVGLLSARKDSPPLIFTAEQARELAALLVRGAESVERWRAHAQGSTPSNAGEAGGDEETRGG